MADLIERQSVLDSFKRICDTYCEDKKHGLAMCRSCYLDDAIDIVKNLPSVQPEVLAHGEGESASDGLMLMIGDDGIAREYSDEFDVVIHCESDEDREKVIEIINSMPLPEPWKGAENERL